MAETLKDLRDKLELNHSKLIDKLEADAKELKDLIDKSVSKVEGQHGKQIDGLMDEAKKLKDQIGGNAEKVAGIEATIKTTKLISIATGIIAAIIGVGASAIGLTSINQFLKDREELRTVLKSSALVNQSAMVDRLEDIFQRVGSLDSLSDKPATLQEIKDVSNDVRKLSAILDPSQSSTYYHVGDAVELYLANNCSAAIERLKLVRASEQNRLFYAYLRGVCSLRADDVKEAKAWLAIAVQSRDTRQASVILNLQGLTSLRNAALSNDQKLADDAIRFFQSSIDTDSGYAPAYFNIACAYAYKKEFEKVTVHLTKLRTVARTPIETIIIRIKEDVTRPTENYLTGYVEQALKVTISPAHPSWAQQVEAALRVR